MTSFVGNCFCAGVKLLLIPTEPANLRFSRTGAPRAGFALGNERLHLSRTVIFGFGFALQESLIIILRGLKFIDLIFCVGRVVFFSCQRFIELLDKLTRRGSQVSIISDGFEFLFPGLCAGFGTRQLGTHDQQRHI